jgi:hypothetical protein
MKLTLNRLQVDAACTIGQLLVDGEAECYVLEDKVREVRGQPVSSWKIYGQTAIPVGTYAVIIDHSEHFGRDLPHILNVPGFEGVRIHPGNTAKDTEGCLLVGLDRLADSVGRSRLAFDALFPKIQRALANGELVNIEIA